ncbi:CU044_5270 family protein [Nonomuraea sp. NPDC000554]|uniref:CU044_5270 family protein n=1 Tax=Nonomuraea sp. NPDC000554 TaxID=3154259 RepID=UPI00332E199F
MDEPGRLMGGDPASADELGLLRELHGRPEADPALRARVRDLLVAEPRRARRRRLGWSVALAGLAAALVAGVLVLPGGRAPDQVVSGRSILLAAAASAASGPASRDGYWHVRKQSGTTISELWATRDGRAWRSEGTLGARPRITEVTGRAPFSMAGRDLTFAQIQRLPADAGALKERVAGVLPAGSADGVLADALSGLLWSKPSPPGVRAAAYRLLADLPNVRYLGSRADQRGRQGDAFSFAPGDPDVQRTLIIDPASSQVLSSTDSGGPDGPGERVELVLEAGWTDKGPPAGS